MTIEIVLSETEAQDLKAKDETALFYFQEAGLAAVSGVQKTKLAFVAPGGEVVATVRPLKLADMVTEIGNLFEMAE